MHELVFHPSFHITTAVAYRIRYKAQALQKLVAVGNDIVNITQPTGAVVETEAVEAHHPRRDMAYEADDARDCSRTPHAGALTTGCSSSVPGVSLDKRRCGGFRDGHLDSRSHSHERGNEMGAGCTS